MKSQYSRNRRADTYHAESNFCLDGARDSRIHRCAHCLRFWVWVRDPLCWTIFDGRLYLNLDAGIEQAWLKDVPGAIKKAQKNWPRLAAKLPSEIG